MHGAYPTVLTFTAFSAKRMTELFGKRSLAAFDGGAMNDNEFWDNEYPSSLYHERLPLWLARELALENYDDEAPASPFYRRPSKRMTELFGKRKRMTELFGKRWAPVKRVSELFG